MKIDKDAKVYKCISTNGKRKVLIVNYFIGNPENDKRILKEVADIILKNK